SALLDRAIAARGFADVVQQRPDQDVVLVLLEQLRDPAGDAADHEQRNEQVLGDAEQGVDDASVEVDVYLRPVAGVRLRRPHPRLRGPQTTSAPPPPRTAPAPTGAACERGDPRSGKPGARTPSPAARSRAGGGRTPRRARVRRSRAASPSRARPLRRAAAPR